LEAGAIDEMLELVPPEPGILAQEIEKLSLLAGDGGTISVKLVRENVGGWRTRTIWDLVDAAAEGRTSDALKQLGRLIASGEKPHGLFPQIAAPLRKLATAIELMDFATANRQRLLAKDALIRAGVPPIPFVLSKAENQLKQIGRQRARQMTSWLLAVDLAIKGHNSADERARIALEQLIVRLGKAPGRVPA
jgi:DNA polymerase-3 subunit delta